MPSAFDHRIASLTADEYVRALMATGWFDAVPPPHRAALEAGVRAAFATAPRVAWTALAATAFDAECIYDVGPDLMSYAAHLQHLSATTYGVFRPSAIRDRREGDAIVITLEYPGRTEEIAVDARSDYFSPRVLDFVNASLPADGPAGRLLALPALDQTLHVAVTTPEAYGLAQEAGLIPTDRDLVTAPL